MILLYEIKELPLHSRIRNKLNKQNPMAALDKTYVNKSQYVIVRNWWIQNRDKMLNELGYIQWLYPFSEFDNIKNVNDITENYLNNNNKDILLFDNLKEENEKYPLWNTSGEFDIYLMKNCNIHFIQNRLIEQYGKDYWGFLYKNKISFDKKSYLYSIHYDKSNLYLYDTEKNYSIPYDKIIVYGTTYIFKLLNIVENNFQIYDNNIHNLIIYFTFHGLPFVWRNGDYFISNENGKETKIDSFIMINSLKDFFQMPNIKHSYKLNDVKKYSNGSIIISLENETFNANHFNGFNTKNIASLNKYIKQQVDDYIEPLIN